MSDEKEKPKTYNVILTIEENDRGVIGNGKEIQARIVFQTSSETEAFLAFGLYWGAGTRAMSQEGLGSE